MEQGLVLAFFWHMHQPIYKDPITQQYLLPWVRLHSTRGYFDMISILEDFPQIKATFNLTPSLLQQIVDYSTNANINDVYLYYTRIPAAELTQEGKLFILKNFFKCNWDTMIKPFPRYWSLLQKRGLNPSREDLNSTAGKFSGQDFLDLQVLFNLAWFGFRAKQRWFELSELIKKGEGFSEQDKELVLSIQQAVVKEVLPYYRKLAEAGQIELTTSPYCHPILPLLWDTSLARRAFPNISLPNPFQHPEDVRAQIDKAISCHKEIFGIAPKGLWPSEGAVCPELIPVLSEAGIEWIATDEGILWGSLPTEGRGRDSLYKPYRATFRDKEIGIVFRDRGLSDLFGFVYHHNRPENAVEDFFGRLSQIKNYVENPLVSIILDGENPWEYYPDGGQGFLSLLYQGITQQKVLQTTKLGDYIRSHPSILTLSKLASGSWINSNYEIWIGSQEDNQAWNYLGHTRQWLEYQRQKGSRPNEQIALALEAIYTAEGSDWFWWYGPQFSNPDKGIFDELFRKNLMQVYRALGEEVPQYLSFPVCQAERQEKSGLPVGFISPHIDGKITHFYEWRAAGFYTVSLGQGAMAEGQALLSAIYFGFDQDNLYFRLDPMPLPEGLDTAAWEIHIELRGPEERKLMFPFDKERCNGLTLHKAGLVSQTFSSIAYDKIIEVGVPFRSLDYLPGCSIGFCVSIQNSFLEIARYPREGLLNFTIPEESFEATMWSV